MQDIPYNHTNITPQGEENIIAYKWDRKYFLKRVGAVYQQESSQDIDDTCFRLHGFSVPKIKTDRLTKKGEPVLTMDVSELNYTFDPRIDHRFFYAAPSGYEDLFKDKKEQNLYHNLFWPSEVLSKDYNGGKEHKFPTAWNILFKNVLPDPDTLKHFINWLAFIAQTRECPKTSWILLGAPGTGKSTVSRICLPLLFGKRNTRVLNGSQMIEDFNGYMKHAWFVCVEEIEVNKNEEIKLYNRLKEWITEDTIAIREMRTNTYEISNFANFVFTTNSFNPMKIVHGDRRFNVSQSTGSDLIEVPEFKKYYENYEDFRKDIEKEVPEMMGYLKNFKINKKSAKKPIDNQERTRLFKASSTRYGELFEYIMKKDSQELQILLNECLEDMKVDDLKESKEHDELKNQIEMQIYKFCNEPKKFIERDVAKGWYVNVFKSIPENRNVSPSAKSITQAFVKNGFDPNRVQGEGERKYYYTW